MSGGTDADEGLPETDPVDAATLELQGRAWISEITALIQSRSADPDPSPRVQLAFDMLFIAACERGVRILNSDKADGQS